MKRMKAANKIGLVLIFCGMMACRQEAVLPKSGETTDPVANFDFFWNGINDNYVFFSYDNLDWDGVYNEYRPKISSAMSEYDLQILIIEMMGKLIDGHRELKIGNGDYAGINNYQYRVKYNDVKTEDLVKQKYIDSSKLKNFYYSGIDNGDIEFYTSRLKNNNKIAYIRYSQFGAALQNETQNEEFNSYLEEVQESNNFSSMIIDVRQNIGGSAMAFANLISKFVPDNYIWGYSKFRLSRDRYETTPFIEEKLSFSSSIGFTKPIVILTDRYSFSAAEVTTLALHNLPNVTVIGDTTAGANGPISSEGKDYTGNFTMPNKWIVQLAQKATFDSNKKIFEGKGVPPDIAVIPSEIDRGNGIDNVLEAAVDFLEN